MKYANDILATLGIGLIWYGLFICLPWLSYLVVGSLLFGCAIVPLLRGRE